jgi:hypothetical protein
MIGIFPFQLMAVVNDKNRKYVKSFLTTINHRGGSWDTLSQFSALLSQPHTIILIPFFLLTF